MGVDFMILMTEEEDDDGDTGTYGDEGEEISPAEAAKRRFSRQQSCLGPVTQLPTILKKRHASFLRQYSQVSYKSVGNFMESSCAITKDIIETTIYVRILFLGLFCYHSIAYFLVVLLFREI